MGRIGIDYQDVARVAKYLVARGQGPTVELVRRELGTGSNTTISKHLRQWRSVQIGIETSPSLPDNLVTSVKVLHESINKEANETIAKIKAEKDEIIKGLTEQLDTLTTQHKNVNNAKDVLADKLQIEHNAKTDAMEQLQKEHATLQSLKHEHEITKTRLIEKEKQLLELNDNFKHLQDNLERYRESVKVARENEKMQFESQISIHQKNIKELNNHLSEEKKNQQALIYQINSLKESVLILIESNKDTHATHMWTKKELAKLSLEIENNQQSNFYQHKITRFNEHEVTLNDYA